MVQQEKTTCPACGKAIKVGFNFCINCGVKLSELDVRKIPSEVSPPPQTTPVIRGTLLMEGWEVSPGRIPKYHKMMTMDPVGDPIITSKCKLNNQNGFLIVSDNGFAWRYQGSSMYSAGKRKWIRWHDVANIIPIKYGQVLVELKIRKYGSLILDGSGKLKIKRWKLTIRKAKGEQDAQWRQRLGTFNQIMLEIFNRNKVEIDPPTSDSRM